MLGDPKADLTQTETDSSAASLVSARELLVPGLTVLGHPDPSRVGERVALTKLAAGRVEELSRLSPLFSPVRGGAPRPLADSFLSRQPIRFASEPDGGVRLDATGSKTAVEADGEVVSIPRAFGRAEVERGVVLLLSHRVVLLLHLVDPGGADSVPDFGLVGESLAMARLRREILRVARDEVPVLLRGETGTGKELVARAIHDASPRRHRPFLAVNMAAIPATLAAAELFGAARGAFTGADRRREGFFTKADGGSLFLDEIGETPLDVQALLLRALESHEVQPVGADAPQSVDVRLVAATDSDLLRAIEAERFRAPLLYRLAGYEIVLPPLRERRDDVGRLFFHFLGRELERVGRADRLREAGAGEKPLVPARVVARLAMHSWPGNVRQLRNVALQLALGNGDAVNAVLDTRLPQSAGDAPAGAAIRVVSSAAPIGEKAAPPSVRKKWRDAAELSDAEIAAALEAVGFRIQRAANALGVSRASLYDRIEKSDAIRKGADLPASAIEEAAARHAGDLAAMARDLRVSRRALARRMRQLGRGGA